MLLKTKVSRRSYDQYCGLARALDVVGERWTLLIVRNLLVGPLRYGELHQSLPGITTNLLAKRLREMEAGGLLVREDKRYALSDRGRALEPAVMALGRWGEQALRPGPRPDDTIDIRWGMLSLKRRYRGERSGSATLVIGERVFRVDYAPEYVDVTEDTGQPGAPPRASLVLEGELPAFQSWIFRGAPPDGLEVTGPGLDAFAASFGLLAE